MTLNEKIQRVMERFMPRLIEDIEVTTRAELRDELLQKAQHDAVQSVMSAKVAHLRDDGLLYVGGVQNPGVHQLSVVELINEVNDLRAKVNSLVSIAESVVPDAEAEPVPQATAPVSSDAQTVGPQSESGSSEAGAAENQPSLTDLFQPSEADQITESSASQSQEPESDPE